jgi:hypothetical protein
MPHFGVVLVVGALQSCVFAEMRHNVSPHTPKMGPCNWQVWLICLVLPLEQPMLGSNLIVVKQLGNGQMEE